MALLVLINNGTEILGKFRPGGWVHFEDEGNPVAVSPAEDGWSYKTWRLAAVQTPEPVPGKITDGEVALVDGTPYYVLVDAPPQAVPDRVTSRQFFLQLEIAGLLDQVEAWIDAQPLPIQIAFERSGTFVREDIMLQSGFAALGFTTEQIDGFFLAADAL